MRKITPIFLLLIFTNAFCQSKSEDLERAGRFVEQSLDDNYLHNVVVKKTTSHLFDKETVVGIAELALFQIYGKENIIKQRPYRTYLINNFWLIEGTLEKNKKGGVFQIVIDDRTGEIRRITHGK